MSKTTYSIDQSVEKTAWRAAKAEKKHDDAFIKSGVWSWSRHPKFVYPYVSSSLG